MNKPLEDVLRNQIDGSPRLERTVTVVIVFLLCVQFWLFYLAFSTYIANRILFLYLFFIFIVIVFFVYKSEKKAVAKRRERLRNYLSNIEITTDWHGAKEICSSNGNVIYEGDIYFFIISPVYGMYEIFKKNDINRIEVKKRDSLNYMQLYLPPKKYRESYALYYTKEWRLYLHIVDRPMVMLKFYRARNSKIITNEFVRVIDALAPYSKLLKYDTKEVINSERYRYELVEFIKQT